MGRLLFRIAAVPLSILVYAFSLSGAARAQTPDPGATGPFAVATEEYDFGDQAFTAVGASHAIELRAVVHHPTDLTSGPLPLLAFIHGGDAPCHKKKRTGVTWPCAPGFTPIPSYRGYDYLGEVLASNGFIVVSISADGINAFPEVADETEQLIQKHLDIWNMFNTEGGPPFGSKFIGKVDMNRIGTMGHSLGGQAIVDHYAFNLRQPSPYGIKAVLALAPANRFRHTINNVPFAVAMGYCDGQIGLSGAHYYDDSLFNVAGDPAPKHNILIMGANHVFFNTVWTPGLFKATPGDDGKFCDADPLTGRLDDAGQRAIAAVYVSAFFRVYVKGESQFLPLLTGAAAAPSSISFAKVFVSYQPPDNPVFRLDVNRMQDAASLSSNNLGGPVSQTGLSPFDVCGGIGEPDHCLSSFDPIMEPHSSSAGNPPVPGLSQLRIAWSDATAFYKNELPIGSRDVSGYEALQFRVGVRFDDQANKTNQPQDFSVELADGAGQTSRLAVSSVSGALYFPPGTNPAPTAPSTVLPRLALNQVRIPLTAFSGVLLRDIRSITFKFDQKATGSLLFSDLTFVATPGPPGDRFAGR
jgi:hypothetical protein